MCALDECGCMESAARGYDGIYSESAKYMVVLNRSKLIVSNEVDYI